jgi:ATP-binding cassette subfamily F protein 3
VLQLNEVSFGYTAEKLLLKGANIDVGLDSRIAIVGANGAGKSTLYVLCWSCPWRLLIPADRIKLLTGELKPISGHVNSNGRLRVYVDPMPLPHNDTDSSVVGTSPSTMSTT